MKKACFVFMFLITALVNLAVAKESYHYTPLYNKAKDDLINQLAVAKTDTGKFNLLNTIVFYNALVEGPADVDTVYLNQLIKLNQSAGLVDDKPYITLRLGLRAGVKKNYKEELALLKTAVEQFDEQNTEIVSLLIGMRYLFNIVNDQEDRLHYYSKKLSYYLAKGQYHNAAGCYHCIAGYYVYRGDFNSAINNYLKAAEIFKSFTNLWYEHDFGVVGGTYDDWGNIPKGLFYLQKALKLETELHVNANRVNLIVTFAEVEYELGNYRLALDYLNRLGPVDFKNTKDSLNESVAIDCQKALTYIALNRLPEAAIILQKLEKLPPVSDLVRLSFGSADLMKYASYKYSLALKDMPKAERLLLVCYHGAAIDNDVRPKIRYLKELVQFYSDQHNYAKAWQYSKLYRLADDSLQKQTSVFNIASYENEQKENAQNKKLIILQQQRAVQEATISQRNTIIWLSFIGLLVVLGSLVFIYRQLQINKHNLKSLKNTQTQLIQSEKMASLGELTAGIAHEIQNPLNFVNNFSEVNTELIDEMQQEIEKGDYEEVKAIAGDIKENQIKISQHGKRADFIVKGMLQHSRTSTGEKQETNINVLADEFLKLSYHGLRAKNKPFNAELVTNFDAALPRVNIVQQDVGRVLLNLFNNAFYAVSHKQKTAGADYKPEVIVTTSTEKGNVIIKVKDNGNGIPDAIKEKIMQPFFTTKPTGEGTGLGLSLSYDIVVKGHGGSITVNSVEREGSEFVIMFPIA